MKKKIFFSEVNSLVSICIRVVFDYIAIVIAELVSIYLRNWIITDSVLHIHDMTVYIIIPVVYILFLNTQHLYGENELFYQTLQRLVRTSLYATGSLIILLYLAKSADETSRFFVAVFWPISVFWLILFRYAQKKVLEYTGRGNEPVLLIGAGCTAALFYKSILNNVGLNIQVIGLLEDNSVSPILNDIPVLGGFADAVDVINRYGIRNVVIAAPGLPQDKLTDLILKVHPKVKHLSVIPNLIGIPLSNISINSFYNEKIVLVNLHNNLKSLKNRIIKQLLDIVLSSIGILLLSPLFILLAIWVKIDSSGPVIYSGKRLGLNGDSFKCYKFRTMYTNGDEILDSYFKKYPDKKKFYDMYHKLNDDPRVTRVGKVLRKLSLDELPQLFNVLLGDMSLVGPRPYLLSEKKDMDGAKDIILMAHPGITGLWQVSGRSEVTFSERLQMDMWYVRNWSVWIDIILLLKTVKVVILHKGAC